MGSSTQGPNTLVGQIVADYRLERVLGVGATGAVFLGARVDAEAAATNEADVTPDAPVLPGTAAIKLLYVPWQLSDEQAEEFRRRFLREAETLSQLRHPHLLPVLASGQDTATGHLYMVMPNIAGTLASRLTVAGSALPLLEASSILDQLAGALDYAHSQGVIHRDIKPANILLDEQGHVYLGDFGILRLLDESRTQLTTTGGVLGTPEYMAPEQARGEEVGPAADRYALAVVLYQMVTGHLPFEGGTPASVIVRQMQDPPPIPRSYRPDLPETAEAVIFKGLAKLPADRFALSSQMAEAFALGLAGILSPLVTPTGPQQAQTLNDGRIAETPATPLAWTPYPEAPALPAGTTPPRRRKGLIWGSLGAAVLLLLTGAVLAALVRPDLVQEVFGGKTATATATQGQVAQVQPTATFTPSPTATPRATATAIVTTTPAPPSRLVWRFPTGGSVCTSPATASGIVYFGSCDQSIYAVDGRSGKLIWQFHTGSYAESTPTVVGGVVYVGSDDQYIYALDASSGAVLWRYLTGNVVRATPAVASGIVYVSSFDDYLYALRASDGSLVWRFSVHDPTVSSNVVKSATFSNGLVYIGADDGMLYALNAATGQLVWQYQTGDTIIGAPAVSNGIVYVSDWKTTLDAVSASNGSLLWRAAVGGSAGLTAPVLGGNIVYIGAGDDNVYALDASSGSTLWTFRTGAYLSASPTLASGTLYIGSDDKSVYALNAVNGALLWSYQTPGLVQSAVEVAYGLVYISDTDHYLYAIQA